LPAQPLRPASRRATLTDRTGTHYRGPVDSGLLFATKPDPRIRGPPPTASPSLPQAASPHTPHRPAACLLPRATPGNSFHRASAGRTDLAFPPTTPPTNPANPAARPPFPETAGPRPNGFNRTRPDHGDRLRSISFLPCCANVPPGGSFTSVLQVSRPQFTFFLFGRLGRH